MKPQMTFRGHVVRVIDGDTCEISLDLGFHVHTLQRLRLEGIDTLELNAKEPAERLKAFQAKEELRNLCEGKFCIIGTYKTDKYGRYVAKIWAEPGLDWDQEKPTVNDLLVKKGLAVKV